MYETKENSEIWCYLKKKGKDFYIPSKVLQLSETTGSIICIFKEEEWGGKDYLPAALLRITQNLYKICL